MQFIEWKSEFNIGHEEIDGQHKQWLSIYKKAHDRMMNGSGEDLLTLGQEALLEMIAYTKSHFAFEEGVMEKIGYPGAEDHKRLHNYFRDRLDAIQLSLHHGDRVLNSEIIKLLENWLVDHILNIDKDIIKFSQNPS